MSEGLKKTLSVGDEQKLPATVLHRHLGVRYFGKEREHHPRRVTRRLHLRPLGKKPMMNAGRWVGAGQRSSQQVGFAHLNYKKKLIVATTNWPHNNSQPLLVYPERSTALGG
jgi:hypothetical protein